MGSEGEKRTSNLVDMKVFSSLYVFLGLFHIQVARQGHTVFYGDDFSHDADGDFRGRLAANIDADRLSLASD